MRRREFISLAAVVAAAWPLDTKAQQKAVPVIGFIGAAVPDDAEVARNLTAFRKGLAETGYVEGTFGSNIAGPRAVIDSR
jgi:hypothetical protein